MPENFSEIREAILKDTKKASENLSIVKGYISEVRGNLDLYLYSYPIS